MNYNKNFKFSLICCTLNTDIDNITLFLTKLKEQTYLNFELILVDQNKENFLKETVLYFSQYFEIKHIKSDKGLSKGRNVGLKHISGDIVAFPDDDCYYDINTLEKVNKSFNILDYDGITIKPVNTCKDGVKILNNEKEQEVTKQNVLKLINSISLFLRSKVVEKVGEFDEKLGLGSTTILKGAEDYDYPIRAIDLGFKLYFVNSIFVFHPWPNTYGNIKNIKSRAFGGGAAQMYLLNKHNFSTQYKIKLLMKRIAILFYFVLKMNFARVDTSFQIIRGMVSFWKIKSL